MSFDPTEHKSEKGDRPKYVSESGTYMLLVTAGRTHGDSKTGKRFTKLRMQVVYGPIGKDTSQVGRVLDERVFRTPASASRLSAYCRAMRRTATFNPWPTKGVTTAQSDAEMENRFLGAALKARVIVKRGNEDGVVFAEVKWPEDDLTEKELAFLKRVEDKWREQHEAEFEGARGRLEAAMNGDAGGDADAFGGSKDDAGDWDYSDDDIPF